MKAIFNAREFFDDNQLTDIPKWYSRIGTYSVAGEDPAKELNAKKMTPDEIETVMENAEFIAYHAAESFVIIFLFSFLFSFY